MSSKIRAGFWIVIAVFLLLITTSAEVDPTAKAATPGATQPATVSTQSSDPRTLSDPVTSNANWVPKVQSFDDIEMVVVPAGCFMMGSDKGQAIEKPVTKICFDKPFYLDKTEVTQVQFAKLGGKAASKPRFRGNTRPVDMINWFEARDFCQKRGGRLPTEAEWEYGARGPDNLIYAWGNEWDATKAVWKRTPKDGSANVGMIPSGASWVGALDMTGNVWEWTSSTDKKYPYKADDGREDSTDKSEIRVMRGGSWYEAETGLLTTFTRSGDLPEGASSFVGFRCSRS